jgi:serine/threonine protein kinase
MRACSCEVHRSDPDAADRLAQAVTAMPEVGTEFLGFRLLQELGKGAFARVYLCQQGELANRFVALKVSPHLDTELQTLAQLQHTNVVPIYSVHRAGALQAVCMPYFGATTLATVLKDL